VSLHFLIAQLEFTHALGPHAGRYVVGPRVTVAAAPRHSEVDARNRELAGVGRGVGQGDVLVIGVRGAPAGRLRLLRRPRAVDPDMDPATVPLTVVTFVKGTDPLDSAAAAAARLDGLRYAEAAQDALVGEALGVLNLAIRAHRVGAPDPYALEVTRRDAREVVIGHGTTEEVQDGRFSQAFELPPPVPLRLTRIARLRPTEAVATLLSGRGDVLEAEDVLARAVVDLDNARTRGAAHQAAAAMRLLRGELAERADRDGLDIQSLAALAQRAETLAAAATTGPLTTAKVGELEELVDSVAGILDGWRFGGVG
jgi:hypothetical protein